MGNFTTNFTTNLLMFIGIIVAGVLIIIYRRW